MRAAVISLTEKGRQLSLRIARGAQFISAERFCFKGHSDQSAEEFESVSGLIGEIFNRYDALIFVCACGIAVRAAAPFIRSKATDPAVVVTDDCGRFVIPVLSGHIGGANALSERIAELIGAQAAITTATDTGRLFSPDSFAAANGLILNDLNAAKLVAAAVLDGEKAGFISDLTHGALPEELSEDTSCRTGIYVGCGDIEPFSVTLKLVPANIVLGIGCKRGTDAETIRSAVMSALGRSGIAPERICAAATIDLKANEAGLLGFCEKSGIELTVYTSDELMQTEGDFTSSDFVKGITGADNVCERSAVRCSGGRLILRKTAVCGVTVAAAEKPLILDFERKIM